jgi:hypothetical protein
MPALARVPSVVSTMSFSNCDAATDAATVLQEVTFVRLGVGTSDRTGARHELENHGPLFDVGAGGGVDIDRKGYGIAVGGGGCFAGKFRRHRNVCRQFIWV